MLVLALDTSSAAVTAGLLEVGDAGVRLLAEQVTINARGHGELLAPGIAAVLAEAGAATTDLGAVVAGTGPGPYTGLRVGLVTAAVLGEALRIPAYAVCSLDAIADTADPDGQEAQLLVVTDARRRELYWARYERGQRSLGPSVDRPADIDLAGVSAVCGAGVQLHDFPVPSREAHYPSPLGLARCAAERIRTKSAGETLTPLYLRRPDAVVPGAPKQVSQ